MAETMVVVEGVSKRFTMHRDKSLKDRVLYFRDRHRSQDDFWALHEISLDVRQGETVGLIGHNGSGKSTLLKAIGGIIQPSSGRVLRRGRVAALLELGAGFHQDLSGRENVYINAAILGLTTAETDAVFDEIVDFAGIGNFIDTQVKFYSSGMYVRLAFAVAVHSDPDLLLVDEVLAVGDEPFQQKCMAKIRQFQREGRTIILVSHSAEQVADVCTRAVVLDGGKVVHDGEVGEGIRVLREGYERERVVDAHAGGRIDSVRLHGVDVTMDGRPLNPRTPIPRGSDLTFSIVAQVVKPGAWITGFTLHSLLGQTLYFLNTEGLGIDLPEKPGVYRIDMMVEDMNLGREKVTISVGATTIDGETLALIQEAGSLNFAPDPVGGGVLQFAAKGNLTAVEKIS